MKWSFVKPLQNDLAAEMFEADFGVKFPAELKKTMEEYNGGWPSPDSFLLPDGEECAVKHLLSLNPSDKGNIWDANSGENIRAGYVFFARDPFGSKIAFRTRDGAILFADEETDELSVIAPNFREFLNSLKEAEA